MIRAGGSDPGDARPEVYDDSKKIVGRKRHIVVDTDGCLLMVNLTATDIFDSAGAHIDSNHTSRHSPSLGGRTHFRLMTRWRHRVHDYEQLIDCLPRK